MIRTTSHYRGKYSKSGRRQLSKTLYPGGWFTYHRIFTKGKLLKKAQSTFLQDIINVSENDRTPTDRDGYFLCTRNFLEGLHDWDKNEQIQFLTTLKDKGYVNTKRKGKAPKGITVKSADGNLVFSTKGGTVLTLSLTTCIESALKVDGFKLAPKA